MVRSSRLKRRRPPPYHLELTRGGGARLTDPYDGEIAWQSQDDLDFQAEFEDFLTTEDLYDLLDYLVDVGELTEAEADACVCTEEFLTAEDLTGFIPAGDVDSNSFLGGIHGKKSAGR